MNQSIFLEYGLPCSVVAIWSIRFQEEVLNTFAALQFPWREIIYSMCYISLSHEPVRATLCAAHAHTDSHCWVSLFDRPTKSRLYFYSNALSEFIYNPHSAVWPGFWMQSSSPTLMFKKVRSRSRWRQRHDYFAADLHSLFRRVCQREKITQADVEWCGATCGLTLNFPVS